MGISSIIKYSFEIGSIVRWVDGGVYGCGIVRYFSSDGEYAFVCDVVTRKYLRKPVVNLIPAVVDSV